MSKSLCGTTFGVASCLVSDLNPKHVQFMLFCIACLGLKWLACWPVSLKIASFLSGGNMVKFCVS